MWVKLSAFIIKYRLVLFLSTIAVTGFMAYHARNVEMTYDFIKVVPETDKDFIYFKEFKNTFGEDGNILVIGMQDRGIFRQEKFNALQELTNNISAVEGVNEVVSLPTIKRLTKDTVEKKFALNPVFTDKVKSQHELDSLLKEAVNTRFYEGLLLNSRTYATLVAIAIEKNYLNSSRRQEVVENIMDAGEKFSAETGIKLHYAGLPYVRAVMVGKVQKEFKLFLVLAAVVTSIILFFFFRSFHAVFFTFLIIMIMVLWTMGTIVLLGYKITLLTGILPALIIVISIPNCIYMFNKYHQEYRRHRNKVKAISRIIQKIGYLTFFTNTTTAVGFLVLYFTDVTILKEFGLVAGVIVCSTYLISIIVIPSLLSYLPEPSERQLMHLDFKFLRKVNLLLEEIVLRHRPAIYIISFLFLCFSIYGVTRIRAVSYMVDDLPDESSIKSDLAFLESNFAGIMPLEIIVDLGKPKAVMKLSNLNKLQEFEDYLKTLNNVSPPVSILNIVKGSRQAFYNGDPGSYALPSGREMPLLMSYFGKGSENNGLIRSFVDSTGRKVRFSAKVADVGTIKMNELVKNQIEPHAKEIFKDTGFEVTVSGTTRLFLKGNEYLINGLKSSLLIAFLVISVMMGILFKNARMMIIALIPNIIPLLLTMGFMGLMNIPLKPSTALIFSIAFGIAVDDTIHYLSKYRQEMITYKGNVLLSVTKALEEAGVSMIYTSIVLFSGFIIFAWSDFGGTIALGILTSLTLFFAMFTNLTILPALLLTFSKGNSKNLFPIMKEKSRFYEEDDDEEIHVEKITIRKFHKENIEEP
jgi:predicted RND superfamily exporter protein